jgi:SAM-dependent methyltransferase
MCLRSPYQRLFAFGMRHCAKRYRRSVDARKPPLFAALAGDVLEVGFGTCVNLRFLPPGVRYFGVDRNPHMRRYAQSEAARLGTRVELVLGDGAGLPFPKGRFDAVFATLVLCSVADPLRVLCEVRRVLRPGGRYIFIEHVAAPAGSRTRWWQERTGPMWRVLGDGCSPARETAKTIASAGFARVDVEAFDVPVPIFRPHIAGVAVNS